MNRFIYFSLVFSLSTYCNGQADKSIYNHVDSLVIHELKFKVDTTVTTRNLKTPDGVMHLQTIYPNRHPLMILDGVIVQMEELRKVKKKKVSEIQVWQEGNPKTAALYGTGSKGVVIIVTIHFNRRLSSKKN